MSEGAAKSGAALALKVVSGFEDSKIRRLLAWHWKELEIWVEDEATAAAIAARCGMSGPKLKAGSGEWQNRWSEWTGEVEGFEVTVLWFDWPAWKTAADVADREAVAS